MISISRKGAKAQRRKEEENFASLRLCVKYLSGKQLLHIRDLPDVINIMLD
jgi:hypothetical protein